MRLLKRFQLAHFTAAEFGSIHVEERFGGHVAEQLFSKAHDLVMVHRPSGGEDHLVGAVMLADKARQVFAAEIRHAFGRAQNGAPDGLVGVCLFLQPVKDHIIRRIQRLTDLLQDHAALHLDLAIIKDGIAQDIRDHIQPQRHVIFQHAHVISRHFTRGIGVDIAAHILDRFGDLQRRALGRALERHMLKEMRDTVLRGRLMPRARRNPDPDRCRCKPRHMLGYDTKAVGQAVLLQAH